MLYPSEISTTEIATVPSLVYLQATSLKRAIESGLLLLCNLATTTDIVTHNGDNDEEVLADLPVPIYPLIL